MENDMDGWFYFYLQLALSTLKLLLVRFLDDILTH